MKLEKPEDREPEDREMDLLLDEIPNAVSPNPCHDHLTTTNLPTFPSSGLNGFSERSSSSSSSFSSAFSAISDDPLRFSPDFARRTPSSSELGLLDRFRALHVEPEICADQPVNRRPVDNVVGILHRPNHRTVYGSGVMDSWHPEVRLPSYGEDSWHPEVRLPSYGEDLIRIGSVPIHGRNSVFGTGVGNNGGDLVGSFSYVHPHYVNNGYNGYNGYELNQNLGFLKQPGTGFGLMSRNLRRNDEVCYEDGFIVQGKGLRYVGNNARDVRERKRLSSHERLQCRGSFVVNVDREKVSRAHIPIVSPLKYENLQVDVEEYVYLIAKDQHGCRLLQRKFEEGKRQEIDAIFNGIVGHVVELMVNPFGNYLMQKLMEVCTEEQRMSILLVLTKDPLELVRISLDTHGTRSVQKLIETLKTRQQIALVVSALKPGFIDLIKDLNGNHVVQKCLQSFSKEDNKFIFDGAAKHTVEIATHRHGCCVLQRCISSSAGEDRVKLVAEICANGLLLSQDAYGNYVVQFVLGLGDPSAILVSQFEGNYVHLSMQKFSSNVIEKCLKVFVGQNQARIVKELLSVSRFDQLLQDPYANYVIQSALASTKGDVYSALVEAIRPHHAVLRTNPYCKRIYSRTLLKK